MLPVVKTPSEHVSLDVDPSACRSAGGTVRGVGTYGNLYRLTYVRGPSGIIVMLAEELRTS